MQLVLLLVKQSWLPMSAHAMEEINLKDIIRDTDLAEAFDVKSGAEWEFIEKYPVLIEVLPFIEFMAKKVFRQPFKFTLELLDEGDDWRTLFITGEVDEGPLRIEVFYDLVFNLLFNRYPEIASKLNIDIRPK